MERLKDKVAIITGGAHGIGRAFCSGLAREGAKVVVADVNEELANEVVAELTSAGHDAVVCIVDVTSEESTRAMAQQAIERFGGIDILVTCAAIYAGLERKPFLEMDAAEWNKVLDVNLNGVALSIRAVLPTMKEQGSGVVITMGSVNTFLAPEGRAHYSAGKAALENLTKTLAREMGPFGIRVNALSPGLVRHTGTIVPDERYDRMAQERALRRDLAPEDL
ncbi:MAG: SDR family NAD(P)-dependent oxidoreductase, partial [Dehalococcoidia bacterium]